MKPATQPSALLQTTWHEYFSRFLIGGVVTAVAGVIAHKYGPVLGGLFLAFPSIFPASATLIEKHEERREKRNKVSAQMQGRRAVEMDAFGAAMGALGLLTFAFLVWRLLPVFPVAGAHWFHGRVVLGFDSCLVSLGILKER